MAESAQKSLLHKTGRVGFLSTLKAVAGVCSLDEDASCE